MKPIEYGFSSFFVDPDHTGSGSPSVNWSITEQRNSLSQPTLEEEFINSLSGYNILQPIHVTYERLSDTEVMATFEEANFAISGLSRKDAFQALLEEILVAFDDWTADESKLGRGPQEQLAVLKKYLGKA